MGEFHYQSPIIPSKIQLILLYMQTITSGKPLNEVCYYVRFVLQHVREHVWSVVCPYTGIECMGLAY